LLIGYRTLNQILKKLDASHEGAESSKKHTSNIKELDNSTAKLFEEIKIMFQDLPGRIERTGTSDGRKRKRRMHPGMLDELINFNKNPRLGIRVALSLYRDRMPWIYDEGTLLLNKIETNRTQPSIQKAFREFEELLMSHTRNPMMEELLMDDHDDFILMMELPRLILRNVERLVKTRGIT
jgi:hypothetical protein